MCENASPPPSEVWRGLSFFEAPACPRNRFGRLGASLLDFPAGNRGRGRGKPVGPRQERENRKQSAPEMDPLRLVLCAGDFPQMQGIVPASGISRENEKSASVLSEALFSLYLFDRGKHDAEGGLPLPLPQSRRAGAAGSQGGVAGAWLQRLQQFGPFSPIQRRKRARPHR